MTSNGCACAIQSKCLSVLETDILYHRTMMANDSLKCFRQSPPRKEGHPKVDLDWKINPPKVKVLSCPVLRECISHEIPFSV